MTWLQLLAAAGVMGTFLGIGLAFAAYFHRKHIKESAEQTNKILSDMDQRALKNKKL